MVGVALCEMGQAPSAARWVQQRRVEQATRLGDARGRNAAEGGNSYFADAVTLPLPPPKLALSRHLLFWGHSPEFAARSSQVQGACNSPEP